MKHQICLKQEKKKNSIDGMTIIENTELSNKSVCGGRWEGGSRLGTCVHPWQIHVDVWQKQYNIVK